MRHLHPHLDQNEDGEWMTTFAETSTAYLRSWFAIDLLAVIPFEQAVGSNAGALRLFKVWWPCLMLRES